MVSLGAQLEKQEALEVDTLKVLHTNFLKGWGGQSNRILTECVGLAEKGWDVLVSAPGESKLVARAREAGLAVETSVAYVGGFRAGVVKDAVAMVRLLKNWRPDIIHLHGGRDSWAYAYAAPFVPQADRPIVIRSKHNIFPVVDHPLNRWQYGKLFESIVCISSAIARDLESKSYIDGRKLAVIPSAIDVTRFEQGSEVRAEMRRELGYGDDEILVGITGRLRPEKAHDVLFRAMKLVVEQCPQVRLLCFGSGSLGGELGELVDELGIGDYVNMVGFRKDVPRCLAALDVYAQPSRSEGLGTSVLEACAAGLPVVASNSGGIPDIIKHDRTGLLVPVEDSTALAREIMRAVRDENLRSELGQAAHQYVAEKFSVEGLVAATLELYESLMSNRGKLP